jgi:hypothetical protein
MLLDLEGTSFIFKEEVFLDDYDSTIFFLSLQERVLTVYNIEQLPHGVSKFQKIRPSRQGSSIGGGRAPPYFFSSSIVTTVSHIYPWVYLHFKKEEEEEENLIVGYSPFPLPYLL